MSALISLSDADIMPLFSNCCEDLSRGRGSQHRQWEGLLLSALRLYNYLCLIYCSRIIWADSHKSVQCSINLCNISSCNQMSYFWSSQLGLILRPLAPAFPWAMWSQCVQREIVLALSSINKEQMYLFGGHWLHFFSCIPEICAQAHLKRWCL